jgi:hypothetical protein
MSPRPHRLLGALALLVCSHAGLAESAPFDMRQVAAVRDILPGLDDADFVKREAASKRLRDDPTLSVDALGIALAEPNLTAEQSRRLVTAFRERFIASPRPAIGIGFELSPDDPRGVVVNRLNRGLPAIDAGLLQLGDLIVSLNNEPILVPQAPGAEGVAPQAPQFGGRDQFADQNRVINRTISLIQSYDPGDVVTLEVLRLKAPLANPQPPQADAGMAQRRLGLSKTAERERIEVRCPLGLYSNLFNQGQSDPAFLMRAYGEAAMDARLKRLGVAWPGPRPVNALAAILPGTENPPPAFSAKLALGLAGAGEPPQQEQPWAANWNNAGNMAIRAVDAQGRVFVQNGNRMVQMPRGVAVQLMPGRGMEDALAAKQRAAMAVASVAEDAASGAASNKESTVPAASGVSRDLRRLAELQSDLAAAELRLSDSTLDQPSQREAQKRAAELRTAVDHLVRSIQSPGFRAEPTVSAENESGLDR